MQPESCVLVEGLCADTTTDDLYASFSEFGHIAECHVVHHAFGHSLRYGLVTYETVEPATKLVDGRHGAILVGTARVHLRNGNSTPHIEPEQSENKRHRPNDDEMRFSNNKAEVERPEADRGPFKPSVKGRKVFVGGILPEVNTDMLRDAFGELGTVSDAVLHKKDGQTRSFAFVTYEDPLAAQEALLKPVRVGGRRVYVEFAEENKLRTTKGGAVFGNHRRPLAEDHDNMVFIRKLPRTVNHDRLKFLLGKFGEVAKAYVNQFRGTGFVEYTDISSAKTAAEEKWIQVDEEWAQLFSYENREEHDGNFDELMQADNNVGLALQFEELEVTDYVPPTANGTNEPDVTPEQEELERLTRLFIGNIPKSLNSQDLRDYFATFVKPEKILDVNCIIGRGFAFVLFADEATAASVLSQNCVIDGRLLNIMYGTTADTNVHRLPKGANSFDLRAPISKGKLFVGQVDHNVSEHEFRDAFKVGKIIDTAIFPHRGFGYVQFADHEMAEKALVTETSIRGRRLKLSLCNIPMKLRKAMKS